MTANDPVVVIKTNFLHFRDLQALALLIACFCHDLDHRGTNNSFHMEIKSPLAKLYSSEGSVNERHHLSQAICILNEENSKILDCLSTEQFKACIDDLRKLILATDLANHFRYWNYYQSSNVKYSPSNNFRILKDLKELDSTNLQNNQMLLMSLIMTCCDLSDQVRSFVTSQNVAVN